MSCKCAETSKTVELLEAISLDAPPPLGLQHHVPGKFSSLSTPSDRWSVVRGLPTRSVDPGTGNIKSLHSDSDSLTSATLVVTGALLVVTRSYYFNSNSNALVSNSVLPPRV